MRKIISIVLAVLLTGLAACQPTPTEEIATQKDAEIVEKKLSAVPTPDEDRKDGTESYKTIVDTYKTTLPAHWSDYIETDFIQMPIEADVIVENTDGFPVYKIKRGTFNLNLVESIANQMMPNVTGIREGNRALPEEYAVAIASLNKRGMTEYAEYLLEESKEAEPGNYANTDYVSMQDGGDQAYVVRLADGKLGWLSMKHNDKNKGILRISSRFEGVIHPAEMLVFDGSYEGEGSVIVNPSITKEQAEKVLNEFLRRNGLENYCVERVKAGRNFNFMTREEISQGWRFELVPSYGYYAMDAVKVAGESGGWLRLNNADGYAATWNEESICVYISENGVEDIQWNYPFEFVECVNPCVELMDFGEIRKKFINLLTAGISWLELPCTDEPTVTKVVLTVIPQQMKDDPETAYLMPVWICMIDWHTRGTDLHSYELIGINAIDGSRVALG